MTIFIKFLKEKHEIWQVTKIVSCQSISSFCAGGSLSADRHCCNIWHPPESVSTAPRSKHSFNGWYTEPVGGSRVTTATVFTGDTTIYAQWTAKSSSASPTAPTLPVTGDPALQKHLGTLLVAGILVTLVVVAAV